MGVRFLESYLEKQSSGACYHVNIPDIVQKYRKENGKDPVIVVDGLSCTRPLTRDINWLTGGQFKEALDKMNKFLDKWEKLGCKLVVFFDGPVQDVKIPTWKQRRLTSAERHSEIFSNLSLGAKYIENAYEKDSILPTCLKTLFIYALSEHANCKVITSIKECDEEIAQYAHKNKCFAILAQDSDYVIYQCVPYYLSMKNLNIEQMTTLCYDGKRLAAHFGFSTTLLPLFASLIGNDIVMYDSLRDFHSYLKREYSDWKIVSLVGQFVRSHSTDNLNLASIATTVFKDRRKETILKRSIDSYKITNENFDTSNDEFKDENWNKIVKLAKKKCVEGLYNAPIFDIIISGKMTSGNCLEDFNPYRVIKPCGEIMKELRRSMYGVLLKEKPLEKGKYHYVNELVMTGFNSMEDFEKVEPKYLVKVEHPGLLKLWMSSEDNIQDIRWQILGEIFTVDPDLLKDLPPYMLVPVLTARYFKRQFAELQEFEIDAQLACSVCVRGYTWEELKQLPSDPLTYRQIWIYTVVTKIHYVLGHLLFFIGEPIEFKYVVPHNFADGKLFHEKYRKASKPYTVQQLCENQENLEIFNTLKAIVME